MRYPYDAAKTLYWLGQVEASAERVFQARRRLMAAKRIFRRLGERLYHDYVVEALGRLNSIEPSNFTTRHE
jgi:hypothetical protein